MADEKPWESYQAEGPWSNYEATDETAPEGPISIYGGIPDLKRAATGLADVATTMGTGAVTSIAGGALATAKLLFGPSGMKAFLGLGRDMKDLDVVKAEMEAFNDAYTWQPKTEVGQKTLESMAGPLMAIDEGATDIAEKLGGGNPLASTIIKTTMMGALELASPAKGVKGANTAIRHLAKSKRAITETAENLGIKSNIRDLKESVVDAANRMTPDEKGANAPLLQEAMREAEVIAKDAKNAAYETARTKEVWVDTRAVNDLGAETRLRLDESYDLSEMPKLNKRLNEMAVELPPNSKVRFWELEKIRRRINNNIKGLRVSDPEQAAALGVVKRNIDRFVENEFNKTALEVGQQGPPQKMNITGEHEGIQAWKDAREANVRWRENFHSDRAIKDLIEQDASPEVITDWIVGATAMRGGKQAVQTVARLKQVLGDSHPAIEGIRQDFLFRVAEPLLQETPNFNQFIRNYDTMIRRNHSLVSELGLSESNFNELITFAREARKLPANERNFKLQDLTKGLAVFWQGHSMAKRALRVGYARNILNGLFNMDRVAQKTLLYDMAGIRYGYPAMPKRGPLAAQFIAGSALNELAQQQDDRQRTQWPQLKNAENK